MQAIFERAREGAEVTRHERVHEQRGALQAVDGVGARHLWAEQLARFGRAERVIRHHEHEREPFRGLDAAQQRSLAVEREREPAGDRRGDVVGVALQWRRQRDQLVGVVRLALKRKARRQPGHDRRARRARPRLQGHGVVHVEREPLERPVPHLRERAHHEVRGIGRQRLRALAAHAHLEWPGSLLDLEQVAQRQRDAQAVVPRPEIGRRAGTLTLMRFTVGVWSRAAAYRAFSLSAETCGTPARSRPLTRTRMR